MEKTLYIRGFDKQLHSKLNKKSKDDGLSPAAILEDAFENWLKNQAAVPNSHSMVLYSEDESLLNFLKKIDELTAKGWTRQLAGSEEHIAVKYLKKKKWNDSSIHPYSDLFKKPEKYTEAVFQKVLKNQKGLKNIFVGFMTGDIAHDMTVHRGTELEKRHNAIKGDKGITICPFRMEALSGTDISAILNVMETHDKIFFLNKDIVELNMHRSHPSKVII